jgi:hypothetical protein
MADIIDTVAMTLSSTLLLAGIVVLGAVEILDGTPYGAAPTTNEAGEVIAQPGVDPAVRVGLVLAGLAVLGLWGLYRLAIPATRAGRRTATDTTTG